MITEAVLTAFMGTASWLLGLLPLDPVDWPEGAGWAEDFAASIGGFDALVPFGEFFVTVWLTLTVVAPVVIGFYTIRFVYFLLPFVK